MSARDRHDTIVAVVLAEYAQLKNEQQARIQHRDGLVYTTLAAMGAILAATLQQHNASVLLLVPPVAAALCWKYLAADEKIAAAGQYVREALAPRVAQATGLDDAFGWETAYRGGVYRRLRRWVQLASDLLVFCAIPAAALVVFWALGPRPADLLLVSAVDAVLLASVGCLAAAASLVEHPASDPTARVANPSPNAPLTGQAPRPLTDNFRQNKEKRTHATD